MHTPGIFEEEDPIPEDAARLTLAESMGERVEIMRGIGAEYFGRLDGYRSEGTFLRAWEWKYGGEVGKLSRGWSCWESGWVRKCSYYLNYLIASLFERDWDIDMMG